VPKIITRGEGSEGGLIQAFNEYGCWCADQSKYHHNTSSKIL